MNSQIHDLRTAIDFLKTIDGQFIDSNVAVNPTAELASVYRYIGAGGTVMRPTKIGPAMLFSNVIGHSNASVLIGLFASRERVAHLLGSKPEKLGFLLNDAVKNPIKPILIDQKYAKCQEVIYYASDKDFDIRKILPAPTNTIEDAGPYLTLGMCYASDPETHISDITIHRLCLQGKDEISMFFSPGRHLDVFRKKAEYLNKPLPISISIGVDPRIEIATCFEPPTTPLGFNELEIAGALKGSPIELTNCLTIPEKCIAHAEYVIEGELLPHIRCREDQNTNTGKSMPEFPGYTGEAVDSLPIIKVKAITTRKNPIMQTCIGASEEHVNLAGIPTEASIINMIDKAMPGKLLNVYCPPSGGGKFVAILQFKKSTPLDEGRQRQAALLAFSAFNELKHIYIVDEDVDCFDINDVLWAMTTRFQGDVDIITIPGVRCHPLDPSNEPYFSPSILNKGIACKTIFDCTVPFDQKKHFERCKFQDLDYTKWLQKE